MQHSMFRDYFTFTKSQTIAILVLLLLISLASLSLFLIPQLVSKQHEPLTNELQQLISQLEADTSHSFEDYKIKEIYKPVKLTPFSFNPNTLDEAGFKRLGLRDKLVATLLNYRNKGGKFFNKESLKRIYGLHDDEYSQLESFISIPNAYSNSFSKNEKEVLHIELNSADTAQLVKLSGIGSKLSMNIVKLREQLGGFNSVNQLKEVFGISEETFQKIKPSVFVNNKKIKTINLNAATLFELNTHPYLKGEIARALVDFRKAHNYKIENLSQIKEIALINEEIFRKIVPYLSLQ